MATGDPEKELLENELLRRTIECLHSFMPDLFMYQDNVGYVQVWKNSGSVFYLECKGVNGEYYANKFFDVSYMFDYCVSYFDALRAGYPLWEV